MAGEARTPWHTRDTRDTASVRRWPLDPRRDGIATSQPPPTQDRLNGQVYWTSQHSGTRENALRASQEVTTSSACVATSARTESCLAAPHGTACPRGTRKRIGRTPSPHGRGQQHAERCQRGGHNGRCRHKGAEWLLPGSFGRMRYHHQHRSAQRTSTRRANGPSRGPRHNPLVIAGCPADNRTQMLPPERVEASQPGPARGKEFLRQQSGHGHLLLQTIHVEQRRHCPFASPPAPISSSKTGLAAGPSNKPGTLHATACQMPTRTTEERVDRLRTAHCEGARAGGSGQGAT
jgi:hypothetical protein